MKLHKIEQNTPEWWDIRKKKLTASNAQSIAANGKGLETYVYSLLAEAYAITPEEQYTNADIERGNELEEQARDTYEIETGRQVEKVGFVEVDEHLGCSPDGLIGEEGGLEIKCVNNTNFFKLMVNGEKAIDPRYEWQVQMSMLITGRKWWDLAFYNVNFEKNLLIFQVEPDMAKQEKLTLGIDRGKKLIKEIENKL